MFAVNNNTITNNNNNTTLITQSDPSNDSELSNKTLPSNCFKTGRWTDEEHQKFIEGILEYGNEWKKVQKFIKTRSSTQARSHAQKFFLRIKKSLKHNENYLNNTNNLEGSIGVNNTPNNIQILNFFLDLINPNEKINVNGVKSSLMNKLISLNKEQKQNVIALVSKFKNIDDDHQNKSPGTGCNHNHIHQKKSLNYRKLKTNVSWMDSMDFEDSNSVDKLAFSQTPSGTTAKQNKIFYIQKDIQHRSSMENIYHNDFNNVAPKETQNIINSSSQCFSSNSLPVVKNNVYEDMQKYFSNNNFPINSNAGIPTWIKQSTIIRPQLKDMTTAPVQLNNNNWFNDKNFFPNKDTIQISNSTELPIYKNSTYVEKHNPFALRFEDYSGDNLGNTNGNNNLYNNNYYIDKESEWMQIDYEMFD